MTPELAAAIQDSQRNAAEFLRIVHPVRPMLRELADRLRDASKAGESVTIDPRECVLLASAAFICVSLGQISEIQARESGQLN